MSLDQPTLEGFVRHAERFGSELVYETATSHLEPDELGLLSLGLQRIDRKWRLTPEQKRSLALALLGRSLPVGEIAERAQLHRSSVRRLRQEHESFLDPCTPGKDTAQPYGGDVAHEPTPTTDTSNPEMRHVRR